MRLVCLQESEYTDQHSFPHKCYLVVDEVDLTRTDDFIEWEYYETMKDYIWVDGERRFRCRTPTDFGCGATWSEIDSDNWERVARWVELKKSDRPLYHLGEPVIGIPK